MYLDPLRICFRAIVSWATFRSLVELVVTEKIDNISSQTIVVVTDMSAGYSTEVDHAASFGPEVSVDPAESELSAISWLEK